MLNLVDSRSVIKIIPYELIMDTVNEHSCHRPKPTVVTISDLLATTNNDDLRFALLYDPPSVVLHQCGGSGCCQSKSETCTHSEHEELFLEIAYLSDPDYVKKTYLLAWNHTACKCAAKNNNRVL
ncbi:hypothetical protein GWI33_008364 [Rhynchophorus ferrugineus]|uniref:Platelet-derived growth factor (PDGF) family profile domain-containing protein n=1 Tax=Rhynchophorus ferrugineus TaxID=354439 RepID=A0A834MJD7_RHYFE|nr:hypothetical protein GWI33_008364 [Rhynchophorus ferrugineus]